MKKLALLLLLGAVAFAGVANAAPVHRSAFLSLTVTIQGLPGIVMSGSGSVWVDAVAKTLLILHGAIVQTAPITIPVTASTAIASVKATGFDNLTGFFSIGGAITPIETGQTCSSASPPPPGVGCVGGTNLGGPMALSGTVFAVIVPMLVTVPVPMVAAGIGVGGFTRLPNTPAGFLFDAAPFTKGVAKVGYTATSKSTWMGIFMGNPVTVTYTMSWISVAQSTGGGFSLSGTPPWPRYHHAGEPDVPECAGQPAAGVDEAGGLLRSRAGDALALRLGDRWLGAGGPAPALRWIQPASKG